MQTFENVAKNLEISPSFKREATNPFRMSDTFAIQEIISCNFSIFSVYYCIFCHKYLKIIWKYKLYLNLSPTAGNPLGLCGGWRSEGVWNSTPNYNGRPKNYAPRKFSATPPHTHTHTKIYSPIKHWSEHMQSLSPKKFFYPLLDSGGEGSYLKSY